MAGEGGSRWVRRMLGLGACLVLALSPASTGAQSSSDNFVLQQSSVNAGGDVSASSSFHLTNSVGQKNPIGASSSFLFLLQSGFLSFAGTGPVPTVLAVDRNELEPQHCDLYWSGNEPNYDVFVGDCSDVFGSLYGSSSANSLLDVTPLAGTLTCFNVVSGSLPSVPAGSAESTFKENRE